MPLAYNKFGLMSFYDKDHGACDGSALQTWADQIRPACIKDVDDITLVCMPRVLGYVFNPVSFCYAKMQTNSSKLSYVKYITLLANDIPTSVSHNIAKMRFVTPIYWLRIKYFMSRHF